MHRWVLVSYCVVIICIFLMTSEGDHLLMCLFSIFNEVSVQSFCPFLNGLFLLILLSFESILICSRYKFFVKHVICKYPPHHSLPQSMASLFILLVVSSREQSF